MPIPNFIFCNASDATFPNVLDINVFRTFWKYAMEAMQQLPQEHGTPQFKNCQGNVFIGYFRNEDEIVIPLQKKRNLISVRKSLLQIMLPTKAKKTVFEADCELGGLERIENYSAVPHRSCGYEVARSKCRLQHEDDPFKKFLVR